MGDHTNPRLPLWLRVAMYAEQRHGEVLARGELRADLDPTLSPTDISRAIKRGVKVGVLQPQSSARALFTTKKQGIK